MYQALVIARQGKQFIVEDQHGQQHHCHIRSKALDAVCGDIVFCTTQEQSLNAIESIQPRKNQITRIDGFNRDKILAANIDHMYVVIAAIPAFSLLLIDKYLACAELIESKVSIVINKCEALHQNAIDIQQLHSIYTNLCSSLIVTSAKLGYGISSLRKLVQQGNSVLVGQSGVGKSSLINRLLNTNKIEVADLSQQIQQGTHTTSTTYAYSVGTKGKIIDSPGVRSFSPKLESLSSVAHGFREFLPYIGHCKFSDCLHIDEPNCAVKKALNDQLIHPSRYSSYLSICTDLQ